MLAHDYYILVYSFYQRVKKINNYFYEKSNIYSLYISNKQGYIEHMDIFETAHDLQLSR